MSIVERFLPPPGAPGAIRDAADAWRDCAGQVRGLGDQLNGRASVLSSSWWGSSKEAFVARTWPFLRQLEVAAQDLDQYAATLDRLADAIEAAQREYHARMIAAGATAVIGVALTVFTATLSDEVAAGAVTAELATATELATTAAGEAAAALSMLTAQAGQLALRVLVFSGVNVAGDAVGAAVAYDDGRPWAHLHLHDDLEWGAIGGVAMPLGAGTLGALSQRGVALSGASGTAIRLGVGGLSTAQADVLVRGALGEHVDADELAMAALPLGAAGGSGGRASRLPPEGVEGIVDRVHLPPGVVGDSELFRIDLEAQEKAGGHILEKHVGKTQEYLRLRLNLEPDRSVVSTFFDRYTAEKAVAEILRRHDAQIQGLARGKGQGPGPPARGTPQPRGRGPDEG